MLPSMDFPQTLLALCNASELTTPQLPPLSNQWHTQLTTSILLWRHIPAIPCRQTRLLAADRKTKLNLPTATTKRLASVGQICYLCRLATRLCAGCWRNWCVWNTNAVELGMKARLGAGRPRNDASIPGEGKTVLSFLENVQTGSSAHSAPCWMGTAAYFAAGKAAAVWSRPLSAAVKNAWNHIFTPPPTWRNGLMLNLLKPSGFFTYHQV